MKGKEEVIQQFNDTVNMSADELETWLKDPQSKKAGTGVGLESGKRIKEILEKNPDMDPDGYDEVRVPTKYVARSVHYRLARFRRTLDTCERS